MLLHSVLLFGAEYCDIRDLDLEDETGGDSSGGSNRTRQPYIEVDGVVGLTDGDTLLHPGDRLPVGVTVHLDECNVW